MLARNTNKGRKLMKYSPLLSPNLYFLLMLKITLNKFLSQNLQIGKLEGTSGNLRGPSGTLEPDKCGDACARGGTLEPDKYGDACARGGRLARIVVKILKLLLEEPIVY